MSVLKLIELAASIVWWWSLWRVLRHDDPRFAPAHYTTCVVFAAQSMLAGSVWSLAIYFTSALFVNLHGRVQQMRREIAALHEVRTAINQEYNP